MAFLAFFFMQMGQLYRVLVLKLFFTFHQGEVEVLVEDVERFIMPDSEVFLLFSAFHVPQLFSHGKTFFRIFKLNLKAVLKKVVFGYCQIPGFTIQT